MLSSKFPQYFSSLRIATMSVDRHKLLAKTPSNGGSLRLGFIFKRYRLVRWGPRSFARKALHQRPKSTRIVIERAVLKFVSPFLLG